MMMYNTLKCFGEGRKKGCAINKILFYDQKHINDGCVGVIAHMYLQVIPPLGGSFTGKKQGHCRDDCIWQWLISTISYLLEGFPHKKLHSILQTRARRIIEGKVTSTAQQGKTQ